MTIFIVDLFKDVTLCTPIHLVEIHGHVIPYTPVLLLETSVHTLMQIFYARDVCAHAYAISGACASMSILAHTTAFMCIWEQDSASIRARTPASIHACIGCSPCIYVVLSNNDILDFIRK